MRKTTGISQLRQVMTPKCEDRNQFKGFWGGARRKGQPEEMADDGEALLQVEKQYEKLLAEHVEELGSLQRLHYASDRHALLLIFQAMDAAGEDGDNHRKPKARWRGDRL